MKPLQASRPGVGYDSYDSYSLAPAGANPVVSRVFSGCSRPAAARPRGQPTAFTRGLSNWCILQ